MRARAKRWIGSAAIAVLAAVLAIGGVFKSGLAERWMRAAFIREIEQRTGAKVEINEFHFHAWRLRAEIEGLKLHGLEGPGEAPLLRADRVQVAVRIVSFLGRQVALDELVVERPQVAVRFDAQGRNNLPAPTVRAGTGIWHETLFRLGIGRIACRDGSVEVNSVRLPINFSGRNFEFALHREVQAGSAGAYAGELRWQQVEWARPRAVPVRFDVTAKFTLHRDAFELNELVWKLPHSEIELRAERPTFARPDWNLRYRGRLALADLRTIFEAREVPDGVAEVSGKASYVGTMQSSVPTARTRGTGAPKDGEWTASGYYRVREIRVTNQWFHAGGMETSGDYEIAQKRLVVPNLHVAALGGVANGQLELNFEGLAFHTTTQLRGARLASVLAAVDNQEFPVRPLHWDALVDADTENTWTGNFQHLGSKGETRWSAPVAAGANTIPVTARIEYDYSGDQRSVSVAPSEITTPKSQVRFEGVLGAADSGMEVNFQTDDLLAWDDFISAVRGPDALPSRIAGKVSWLGRILGPLRGPTFAGRLQATEVAYNHLYWDEVSGEMEYSPDDFRLSKAKVRRGRASADADLALTLDGDWNFIPSSPWTLNARLDHAPSKDLQELFGTNYPISGILSGDFRGSGTRAEPMLDANYVFDDVSVKGLRFERASGRLQVDQDGMHLSHAELLKAGGRVNGDLLYRFADQQAIFDVTGEGIALEKLGELQTTSVPIAGRLSFHFDGSGSLSSPVTRGDLRVANLRVGDDTEGDFAGKLESDGQSAHVTLASQPARDRLQGELTIGFNGDCPLSGRLSVKNFDLDPMIAGGLHLRQITGHSTGDGSFTIAGNLRKPDSIEVRAEISRIEFNYELVQLSNDGSIRLTYRRNEVRVEQARLRGPDTDLQLAGTARFDRDRPVNLALSGGVNLRLLEGVLPDLDARGRADLNVSIEGTMAAPELVGRATVRNASATYGDFPAGLSKVNGDLVFNRSRLLFDRVTAESGGGQLVLSGSVVYGEGPLRYDVTATTSLLRIRYPTGMSWLAGGTLQLSGTKDAALVSGRVQVERLLFAQGVDVASFFATAVETTAPPASNSPFLRNLAFDVEGQTTPGARIEWTGAHIEVDGNVRLRGTWDRPVLLGHLHLLGGQMAFRGNDFELTRGDLNFSNPLRLDPVLNVEATATISQYQVTIVFSGPASRLTMNYRSDPPLPDSDIVALLALGSTGQESALRSQPGSQQNYGATALLSEAISSGVGGRIERLFGISHFRVDPFIAGTSTESNAAARVTIQQRVARDLTITYSTNAATSNQYQMIQVEYAVKRDFSVLFLRDINNTYGWDIKWVKHFK